MDKPRYARRQRAALAAAVVAATFVARQSDAGVFTWTGNGAPGAFSDPANWSPNVAPPSSQNTALLFGSSSSPSPLQDVSSDFQLNLLAFSGVASSYMIGGS